MAVESSSNHMDEGSLETPIFDESASARAQPVEPIQIRAEAIHQNRPSLWRGRLAWIPTLLGNQTRALAVVVVIGLITGALGGVLMVNASRDDQSDVIEAIPNDPNPELEAKETENLDAFASELTAGPQTLRPRMKQKARGRFRSSKPRAYRVAIIR